MTDHDIPAMTSYRPYLLRALWQWITDNGMTAHLLVDATRAGVRVPAHTVKDGKVVLNIADRAVARLQMGDDTVSFSARFAGVSHAILIPVPAILAIYARETGQGMALPDDVSTASTSDAQSAATELGSGSDSSGPADREPTGSQVTDSDSDDANSDSNDANPDRPGDDARPPRRGGHLRVVK